MDGFVIGCRNWLQDLILSIFCEPLLLLVLLFEITNADLSLLNPKNDLIDADLDDTIISFSLWALDLNNDIIR